MQRREYGEVENADGTTLESQRITPALHSQTPSENQQNHRTECYRGQAQLDWQMRMFGEVAEEERHAEEKHDDTGADQGITAGEVFAQDVDDRVRLSGGRRRERTRRRPIWRVRVRLFPGN